MVKEIRERLVGLHRKLPRDARFQVSR